MCLSTMHFIKKPTVLFTRSIRYKIQRSTLNKALYSKLIFILMQQLLDALDHRLVPDGQNRRGYKSVLWLNCYVLAFLALHADLHYWITYDWQSSDVINVG